MKKPQIISILFALLFCIQATAQNRSNLSFIATFKGHKFYDPGVYAIGEASDATTKGLSLHLRYFISPRVSFTGGYGFAYINGLQYNHVTTQDAEFHHLDLNVNYNLIKTQKRINPYLFFGYGFSKIPQLRFYAEDISGMNTNFGGGLTIPISNGIGIDYNSTYAFSFSPQIRYNFRHQIGVVFTPKAFTNFHRGGEIDSKKYELLLSDNQQLAVANDSLEEEIDLLKFTLNSKDNSTILTASNNDLTKKVRELEEDNQRLLEELRSRRFELDSQINAWYGKYEILDSSGNAMSIGTKDFKSGYYIIKDQIADFEEAKEMLNRLPFDGLMHPFILGKDGKYLVMALLSEDKDSAQLKLDTANGGQNIYRMKEI